MIKILIANKINEKGITLLKKYFEIIYKDNISNKALLNEALKQKPEVIVIRSIRKINEDFIQKISSVKPKIIITASTGVDHIDASAARKYDIKIMNVTHGNHISAAEHTFALILNIYKNIKFYDEKIHRGEFSQLEFINHELSGKLIGIIGVGRVGSYVAKIARTFNMEILGNDIKDLENKYRWIRFTDKNTIYKNSDIITIHTPLDTSTLNMITMKEFSLFKKDSIIINCARGGIINETDLINSLKKKKLKYAGLDVFENEPNIKKEFITNKNILMTPHMAGKTTESQERISVLLAEKLIKYFYA